MEATSQQIRDYLSYGQKPVHCTMVFTEKPVSEQQRVASNLPTLWKHKARMCIRGDQHAGFASDTTTTNADAHLVRLLLALHKSNHVLSGIVITNAFLNANVTDGVFFFW